ncbi:MAG: hypothetical protein HY474_02270 [Candidatus Sungbacteria bacterium]|uniref:Transcobalamin-like C-terminal domain-containing protein n=1 Tax=Candidatus Sungiibacteriota bacterium TaxID=2750080 RepID=A0A932YWN5_9BACT|nr:hypothetical protein [Candidatus Sungbacteria bacterium]
MPFKRVLQEHRSAYWVVVLGGFLAAVALIFFQNEAFYRDFLTYLRIEPSPPAASRPARLTIDFGGGRKRAFEGQIEEGMTILAALRRSGEAGEFAVLTDARGEITAVAGIRSSAAKRWRIYRNGAAVTDLAGHVELQPGDRIEMRYE